MTLTEKKARAEQYSLSAKAAEAQAAKATDPNIKGSFEGIARVYREMAERAQKLLDEDETHHL